MKSRILSAIVIFALAAPLIYLGGYFYLIGISIISLIAYKEICNLPMFDNIPLPFKLCGILFYYPLVVYSYFTKDLNSINYLYLITMILYVMLPSLFYSEKDYKLKDLFAKTE